MERMFNIDICRDWGVYYKGVMDAIYIMNKIKAKHVSQS